MRDKRVSALREARESIANARGFEDVVKAGWLEKLGHGKLYKTWNRRWFVLLLSGLRRDHCCCSRFVLQQGTLSYYANENAAACKGTIDLEGEQQTTLMTLLHSLCFRLLSGSARGSEAAQVRELANAIETQLIV